MNVNFLTSMFMIAVLVTGLSNLSAQGLPGAEQSKPVALDAKLIGQGKEQLANGSAHFRMQGKMISFIVKADEIIFAQSLAVYVNKIAVGRIEVDDSGSAEMNIDTRKGDTVPVMNFGDVIQLFDMKRGMKILKGTLSR